MKPLHTFDVQKITSVAVFALSLIAGAVANGDSLTVAGDLTVQGITTISDNAQLSENEVPEGSLRWDGSAFEGHDGTAWQPFLLSVNGRTLWGNNNTATGGNSTAWGNNNTASGVNSTAWGNNNTASGDHSSAWGNGNTASGVSSNSWGYGNTASGKNASAWGRLNTASGFFSSAWGFSNNVSGQFATVWGRFVNAPASFSTAFGKFNIGSVSADAGGDETWIEADPLIEVGAGANENNRANALTLLKSGRIILGIHDAGELAAFQTGSETVHVQGALKVSDKIVLSSHAGDIPAITY